jgi:hypothetical protein
MDGLDGARILILVIFCALILGVAWLIATPLGWYVHG